MENAEKLRGVEAIPPIMLIELHKDFVIINGITVPRPARIRRSAWLKWWEART